MRPVRDLPEPVRSKLAAMFPRAESRAAAAQSLREYLAEAGADERVALAILKLSEGVHGQLVDMIAAARTDPRDVLAWAEYPEELKLGFGAKAEALQIARKRDREQYARWLASDPVPRTSIRAVALTPAREILLMRVRDPASGHPFWITPGGGMAEGETHASCLARELREELGLARFELGAALWWREHVFEFAGRLTHQSELYYAIEVERFEPLMSDPIEARSLLEFRWWSIAELRASEEAFAPRALARLLQRYIDEGAPVAPLDAGR